MAEIQSARTPRRPSSAPYGGARGKRGRSLHNTMPISARMAAMMDVQAMPVAAPMPVHHAGGGPGVLREFPLNSRFQATMEALGSTKMDTEPFAMSPEASDFRCVDYSKLNEKRHNWKRFDTFQTPTGHVDTNNKIDGILKEQDIYIIRSIVQKEVLAVRNDYAQSVHEMKEEFMAGLKDIRIELAYARKSAREDIAGAVEALKDVSAQDSQHVMESVNHTLEAFDAGLETLAVSRAEDIVQLKEVVKESTADLRPFMKTTAELGPMHVRECQEAMKKCQDSLEKAVERVVEKVTTSVDFTQVLEAQEGGRAALLEAIRKCKASVELSPACQDNMVHSVRDEIQKIRTKVDFTPVLQACRDIKPEVDITAVLAAIQDSKTPEVDLSPVFKAIQTGVETNGQAIQTIGQAIQTGVETNVQAIQANGQAIRNLQTGVDFGPVFDCVEGSVERLKVALDLRQVSTTDLIATVREEINKLKTRVDFTPVLGALHALKPEVENVAVLDAVRGIRREVDLSPVIKAIVERRGEVSEEMLAVMKAWTPVLDLRQAFADLPDSAIRLNMAPILAAVKELKTIIDQGVQSESRRRNNTSDIDFGPLMSAIKDGQAQQGLTNPQIATIHESIVGIYYKILAAIKENRPDSDIPSLLEATRMRLSRENQEVLAKMDSKHTEVLAEVRRLANHKDSWLPAIPAASPRQRQTTPS